MTLRSKLSMKPRTRVLMKWPTAGPEGRRASECVCMLTRVPFPRGVRRYMWRPVRHERPWYCQQSSLIVGRGPTKSYLWAAGVTAEGKQAGNNPLPLEIRRNEPGVEIAPRVSALRCKWCCNPHEESDKPRFLLWWLGQFAMDEYSELSSPLHLTAEDVTMELDMHTEFCPPKR